MIAQSIPEEVASGLRLHQAGRLDEAARLYEAAMARYPSNADACCLLGVVRNQQGRSTVAVPLIQRALALRPGVAAFHANLGLAWQAQGRLPEAADEFGKALALGPEDVAVHVNRGVIVRALGQNELALDHFRRATELHPRLAQARTNLGALLTEMGRPEEALTHCQVAVAIEPRLVEAHINLGNVLRVLGRLAEARACYQQAMRMDPTRAQAASGLGLTAIQVGSWDEALDWFRKAVALEPRSVEFLRHLAEVASDRKLYAEVQSCCERILEIDPDHAIAHNALGYISHEAGRLEEARRRYQVAIRLKPDLAVAHHNLGVLESEMGDLTEAEEHLRMTLKLEPQHATARARLAILLGGSLPEHEIESLRNRLTDPELAPIDRANLLFGLAKVHDSRDEFAETASCLAEANGLILSEQDRLGNGYDPAEQVRLVDSVIGGFTPAVFERLAGAGSDTQRPVFIVGLPRSGTTLLEQILASHPAVHGAGEIPMARRSFEEIPELLGRSDEPMSCMPDVDAAIIGELARRHEDRLREIDGARAERIVTKMPENYYYLGLIAMMFPRAVLIHSRRDLRDVAVSCWMTNFNEIRWANHFDHIARRFAGYRRIMDHWESTLPSTLHVVDYEETVADLEGVARRLLFLCGLEWDPACLEFHRTRRPIRTASLTQVRQPIYQRSVGRWKAYERELGELFARVESGGDA
ncbi:MAG: tetratricopeptide repeat-containing sulfotransferase family protein [Isosphaeraceae bacterium]